MNVNSKLAKFFVKNDTAYIVGSALLIIAFLAIWVGNAYSFILFIVGFICAPVGLFMFFIGSVGKVGQDDIDKVVVDKLWEFDRELMENVRLGKRRAQHLAPVNSAQYDYEGDGLMSRKGKDGAWRTTSHTALRLLFLRDAIAFTCKTVFPLLDDYAADTGIKETAEYKYTELSRAEILRDTVVLKNLSHEYTVKRARLHILSAEGKTLLLVQVNDDLEADALANNINRAIKLGVIE